MKRYSVLDAYLGEFYLLGKDVWNAPGFGNKLLYLVMPPGWSHDGQHKTAKVAKQALLQPEARLPDTTLPSHGYH